MSQAVACISAKLPLFRICTTEYLSFSAASISHLQSGPGPRNPFHPSPHSHRRRYHHSCHIIQRYGDVSRPNHKICTHAGQRESILRNSSSTFAFDLHKDDVSLPVKRSFSSDANAKPKDSFDLPDDACPQGIQGDDCTNFKLWLENCRRYGLANCNDQLQGIQSGRKTLAEVIAEQEKLIADIAKNYQAAGNDVPKGNSPLMDEDFPSSSGDQGEDQSKLWVNRCHIFSFLDLGNGLSGCRTARISQEWNQRMRHTANITHQQYRQHSSSRNDKAADNEESSSSSSQTEEGAPLTQRQKLQKAVKDYGSTVIVFHVTISLASLGLCYTLISSGVDMVGLLTKLGIGESILQSKLATGTGTFVVAYAVHKVFAPVRIATTLAATPFIVRYLRRIGFLKMPKTAKSKQL